MSAVLDIATAPRAATKVWKRGTTTWGEVCSWVDEPRDGGKDGPSFVLGRLSSSRRTKDTVVSRGVLALDADKMNPTARDELLARLRALGCAVVVYSTHSSTATAPRLRALVLASRPVTPDEYRMVVGWLMRQLGLSMFDTTCDQPERFMYMPTIPADGDYFSEVMEGGPFDVDDALLRADLEEVAEKASLAASPPVAPESINPAPFGPLAVPEDVVQGYVAWTLAKLDELAELAERDTLDWPGQPEGVGWDRGAFLAAQRLVQAANSGTAYTLDDAEVDFMAHAPESVDNYDRDHKWASAVAATGNHPMPYEGPADVFTALPDDSEGSPTRAGGWAPVDLTTFIDGSYTPPVPTLMVRSDGVGLLYAGLTHSIYGESESAKSMLVQAETARLLREGLRVCYIDYESDAGSVVERLLLMGVTPDQLGRLVYVQPEMDHERSDATRAAFAELAAQRFALVVLDGVTEALTQAPASVRSTGGLGGNDDITTWHDRLPRVLARRTGAAVVLIDHVAKGPDAGRFAIGGQAKLATISGAAYLVKPSKPLGRGLVGEVEVFVAKDRPGFVRSKAGEFTKDRLQHVGTAVVDGTCGALSVELRAPAAAPTGDDRLFDMMERISQWLSGLPEDHAGAGLNMIRGAVEGNNDLKTRAVRRLVADGYVDQVIKGQSHLHRSARPFVMGFEDDPD